jgi:hypothetical protein
VQKFYRVFDSVESLLAYNTQALAGGARAYQPWRTHGGEWVGRHFASWQEVCAKANAFWPEGLAIIEGMVRELGGTDVPQPVSCRRRARWSADSGDELCNDRLRAGQDYWRDMRRESSRAPRTIALVVKVGAPASYESEDLLWPGATAVTLANLLENAGYRVELWGVSSSVNERSMNDPGVFHAVQLKAASNPLDTSTLANAVAGWFIRTAWYQTRWSEQGYKRPSKGRAGVMAPLGEDGDLIAQTVGNGEWIEIEEVWDRAQALARIREVFASLNP